MTEIAIAAIAIAVAASFLHPAVIAVVKEARERRLAADREKAESELAQVKKDMTDAIHQGDMPRIAALRKRMLQLEKLRDDGR